MVLIYFVVLLNWFVLVHWLFSSVIFGFLIYVLDWCFRIYGLVSDYCGEYGCLCFFVSVVYGG